MPKLYFANCGDGPTRKWNDCYKLGFISAGQGNLQNVAAGYFSNQLKKLRKDDILAVYRNKIGYVGIGQVIDIASDINSTILNGKLVTNDIFSSESNMFNNYNNDYKEWLVPVGWLTKGIFTTEPGKGKCFGIYAKSHIIASLDNQPKLRKCLEKEFNIAFADFL